MTKILLVASLLVAAFVSHAQAPVVGGPVPTPAAAVPLDGGSSLALAAGVAYGLRRLRQRYAGRKLA